MPAKPVVNIGDASDDSENLARYNELKSKANMLIGQHFKLVDIIKKLDTIVADLTWEGVRATRFRAEWASRRATLDGWAGRIAAASNKISDEADNYKV
jgi:hypothetical protein